MRVVLLMEDRVNNGLDLEVVNAQFFASFSGKLYLMHVLAAYQHTSPYRYLAAAFVSQLHHQLQHLEYVVEH